MRSINELLNEHEAVRTMLEIMNGMRHKLEQDETVDSQHILDAVEFAQVFVDTCHHFKEEDFLFPLLKQAHKKEDLMQVLLGEHEQGREFIRNLKDKAGDVAANSTEIQNLISEYTSLIDQHIEKENNDLFVKAEEHLSGIKDTELHEVFKRVEQEKIGEGIHEAFHASLRELSGIYRT